MLKEKVPIGNQSKFTEFCLNSYLNGTILMCKAENIVLDEQYVENKKEGEPTCNAGRVLQQLASGTQDRDRSAAGDVPLKHVHQDLPTHYKLLRLHLLEVLLCIHLLHGELVKTCLQLQLDELEARCVACECDTCVCELVSVEACVGCDAIHFHGLQ